MDKKSDFSFSRFSNEITQSADFVDQTFEGQSPIFSFLAVPQTPNYNELFCIQQEKSQEMSIQDDIDAFNNPYSQYKCYRCYGVQNHSNLRYTLPLCQECQGSEYISQTNPLVSLFQKVLRRKIPQLMKKQQRSNDHLNVNKVICGFCEKKNHKQECFTCQECKDYFLCPQCFQGNKFVHASNHHFIKQTRDFSFKAKQTIQNMKKISEDCQEEEEFYNEEDDIKCTLCDQLPQGCYQTCNTCELNEKKYSVCSKCSESIKFQHLPNHILELRTSKMESKLPQLFTKPSANSSTCTNLKEADENESVSSPQINRQLTKSFASSMVYFPHLELDQSNDMPEQFQNNLRHSETEILWSPSYNNHHSEGYFADQSNYNPQSNAQFTFAIHKKEEKQAKGLDFGNGSMVSIKMQESEDPSSEVNNHCFLEKKQDIAQPTAFAFSNAQKGRTQFVASPEEKKEQQQDYVFTNYRCDMCMIQPIKNIRHHCKECEDYDLCHACFQTRAKNHQHQNFEEIDGRILKRDRIMKFTKSKETQLRQTYVPLRKSTANFSLIRSRDI